MTASGSSSHKHWKLNWWDLWPLVDNDKRPLQWTSESLILSPHPAPGVSVRLFPTSYTFLLPSPSAILGNPNAYSPPTVIEASPILDYIFAYFPSKTEDNVACLWTPCETLDTWKLDATWVCKRGQGIVLAKWLGRERSWSAGNPPTRGCSLGPISPFGHSRLLLVTQNHAIQIVDRVLPFHPFQMASASLLHACRGGSVDRPPMKEMINGPGGVTVCTKAAIGLGYNENSLIVATHTSLVAASTNTEFSDQTNHLPLVSTTTASPPSWDSFGSENSIHLCESERKARKTIVGEVIGLTHTFVANKIYTDSVVVFSIPSRRDETGVTFVGLVDLHGSRPNESGDSQEVIIGKVTALMIPSFDHDFRKEPSNLMASQSETISFVPMSAALSPNESLLCTSNSSWEYASNIVIHPIMRATLPLAIGEHPLEGILAASILSNRSNADILHLLSIPKIKDSDVFQVLYNCLCILKNQKFVKYDVDYTIIKLIIPLFRARGRISTAKNPDSEDLHERSDTALDICSIRALKTAFSSCKEDVGYDTEPVWNLVGLFLWFMGCLERLFRDLILLEGYLAVSGDLARLAPRFEELSDEMDGDSTSYFVPSSLIHLVHPYALRNLIDVLSHINSFRAYLDTLTASKLKSSLAKELVMDTLDKSGLNLKEIEVAIRKISQMEELRSLDEIVLEKSLCKMLPLPETYPILAKACRQLLRPEAISKARMFIKANDLVVGVDKPSPNFTPQSDIISKATLSSAPGNARMCAVCTGKTEVGQVPLPKGGGAGYSSWAIWEREWNRCMTEYDFTTCWAETLIEFCPSSSCFSDEFGDTSLAGFPFTEGSLRSPGVPTSIDNPVSRK
ncbi:hypothetical protein Clacol_010285 [Clathrus columnatus]|uniref:Mediator of RNA polymerase II transcription subunit 16 n=1 Tax=Clathrus columnatus TaxID=1419009 RepID=A0AAV5AMX9_9AGAM|nr:hypothetical protein Clacol_010285 [Clathrus columnatus]